jgi:mannose-6-phosphate isomerase-like protein (cupin superfamily)
MLNPIVRAIGRKCGPAALAAVLVFCTGLLIAQPPGVSVKSPSQIDALNSALRQQAAAGDGVAAAFLKQYPQYYTQLIVRTKSGEVEIHQQYDELMIVRDGDAAVYTGGKPQSLRTVKPGEQRGSAAPGSISTSLIKGTLVYIPAGTPHQVIVPPGGGVAYIDIKVAHR